MGAGWNLWVHIGIVDGPDSPQPERAASMIADTQTRTASTDEPIGARWEQLLGARLGRYELVRRLGAGAMGVVYAGLDPHLGREVAIKVSYEQRPRDLRRFVREARAMAAVDHPHVVTVFDYGIRNTQPYLVMEVLPGGTLRAASAGASFERRCALLVQAGRGLEAAHRVGIVHRDFKPNNVLLDADGSAVVTDFGLAVFSTSSTDADMAPEPAVARTTAAGTPAYMSPEQHAGRWSDARTDQFSFCVTAVEILTGERPFHRQSEGGLVGAKQRGVDPHLLRTLPAHVRRTLVRGLHPRPSARFQNIGALLDALGESGARGSWMRVAAFGGLAACLVGAGVVLGKIAAPACPAVDMPGWDRGARADVGDALRPGSRGDKGPARVVDLLDAHANSWTDARRRACEQERTPASFACLDAGAEAFAALVERLGRGQTTASEAVVLALNLESPAPCLAVADPDDLDRESAAFVAESTRLLSEAEQSLHRGRPDEARQALARAQQAAEQISVARERGLELAKIGDHLDTAGAPEAAQDILVAALATAPGDDRVEALASIALGWTVGMSLDDIDGGQRWLRRAMAAMERFDASLVLRLRAQSHAASLDVQRGDLAGAAGRLIGARELLRTRPASEDALARASRLRQWAQIEHNLCTVRLQSGDMSEALASCQQAVVLLEQVFHEGHPEIADSLEGVFDAGVALGRLGLAKAAAMRSLDILGSARGLQHPSLATVHKQLALTAYLDEDLPEAKRHLADGIGLLPVGDVLRVHYEADMIDLLSEMGQPAEAKRYAVELLEQLEKDGRPELRAPRGAVLRALAVLRLEEGDHDGAAAAIERAYEATEGTRFLAENSLLFAATAARIYRHAGDPQRAVEVASAVLPEPADMTGASEEEDLLVEIIRAHLDAAEFDDAKARLEQLRGRAATGRQLAESLGAEIDGRQSSSTTTVVSSE